MKKEEGWINVHDEALMISLGMHPRNWIAPDFSKTHKEKVALKKARLASDEVSHSSINFKEASFPLYTKVIVILKKNDNFKERVHSRKLWMYQLANYLSQFCTKKGKSVVDHYIYNGKTYYPGELPVNPYKCNGKKK